MSQPRVNLLLEFVLYWTLENPPTLGNQPCFGLLLTEQFVFLAASQHRGRPGNDFMLEHVKKHFGRQMGKVGFLEPWDTARTLKFPNGRNNSKADVALIVYGFHFQSPLVDGRAKLKVCLCTALKARLYQW